MFDRQIDNSGERLHANYEVVRRFLEHYKIFYLIIQEQTRRKNSSVDLPSNKMLAWQHC